MVVTRTDMNHATELYTVDLKNGQMTQLTHVNDAAYSKISLSKVEKRMVKTTDNKEMLVWVVYPPDFNPNLEYPTLLYCQGGPQSPAYTVLQLPLEFTVDGCERLHCCSAKQTRYAGTWRGME